MSRTDQELYDAAREAIYQIMTTGQAISDDGSTLTRADLERLQQAEKYYGAKLAAANQTGRSRLRYVVPK